MYIMLSSRKALVAYTLVTIFSLTLLWPIIAQSAPPTTKEEFRQRILQGIKARDSQAMLALYHWKDIDESAGKMMSRPMVSFIESDLDPNTTVDKIDFTSLPDDFTHEFLFKGSRYRVNVEPVGLVTIEYSSSDGSTGNFSLIYGTVDNHYYFAGFSEERLGDTDAPHQHYAVSMSALPGTSFEGRCEFTADGKEQVRQEAAKEGSASMTIFAEKLNQCQIKRVSGEGPITLIINKVLSRDPLNYEILYDQTTCPMSERVCALAMLQYRASDQ